MTLPAPIDSTNPLPIASAPDDAARLRADLLAQSPALAARLEMPASSALLEAVFGNSPFLSRLILREPDFFLQVTEAGAEAAVNETIAAIRALNLAEISTAELMRSLRLSRQRIALAVALADIGNAWKLPQVTLTLSRFAECAVSTLTDHLLLMAHKRGEVALPDLANPSQGCGLIVWAMGKLGGGELNYSSDIDLIVFYEREVMPYRGARNVQHFASKLAQDVMNLLSERSADGYVFRTDLRLRPDPASTPLAVSTAAAITYYETVGQNWERAAMIKARPIAGDRALGEAFLKELRPFIWRKHLDFAAIADIHSIKRQMNNRIGAGEDGQLDLLGHNIKLGIGGIREIEFFVQTLQLVWGGRVPALRGKSTREVLVALTRQRLIEPQTTLNLWRAYRFHRRVEHRLQMVDDQQTHSLPETDEGFARIATFLGYETPQAFRERLTHHLTTVHAIYRESMGGGENLTAEGNLVFTGVEADKATLETLTRLGFTNTAAIWDMIQGWHRGRHRATRTKRARELLTELVPPILKAMASTANPDSAFFRFDDLVSKLPAGVQFFSLITARAELLDLLAQILGSAPAIAATIGKRPSLLYAVLQGDFYQALADESQLHEQLAALLAQSQSYEERMLALRTVKNEREFQCGIQLLKGMITPQQSAQFLTLLAETLLQATLSVVAAEFAQTHGSIEAAGFAVLALGRLGAKDMTFNSDLDLILVYDAPEGSLSTGRQSYDGKVYYQRFAQRLISALTIMTSEGILYEVDLRLRPSGKDGPLATALPAFMQYFEKSAWLFEFMALSKARVIAQLGKTLKDELTGIVAGFIVQPRETGKTITEVMDMRRRIETEHPAASVWDIKYARGGLTDADFIAQAILLAFADRHPQLHRHTPLAILAAAETLGLLVSLPATNLLRDMELQRDVLTYLRLCQDPGTNIDHSPLGLTELLSQRLDAANFETLCAQLETAQQRIRAVFDSLPLLSA